MSKKVAWEKQAMARQDEGTDHKRCEEQEEIQARLDMLTAMGRLYGSIHVIDAATWRKREQAGQAYIEANDWLCKHGIQPYFDHEQKCYKGIPMYTRTEP